MLKTRTVLVIVASTASLMAGAHEGPSVMASHPGGDLPAAVSPARVDLGSVLDAPRLAPEPKEGVVLDQSVLEDPIVNLQTGIGYSDLQSAIDAASPGDVLRVQQDLAEGRITIDRDIVLEGLTGGETIRATEPTGSSGDDRAWFLVESGVELHVRDLMFDGDGFAIYQAFRHKGTGSFERVHFNDIQYEPSGPAYAGYAVAAAGGRVDVRDSVFEQIGHGGVLYFGTVVSGALFERNTYAGKGDGDFLDYGVELGAGATAIVWQSTFRDCRGISSSGTVSAGILATTFFGAGTAAVVGESTLIDSAIGVAVGANASDTSLVTVAFSRIVGNGTGAQNVAAVEATIERNWWGCNGGPGTPGCDGVDGDGVIDADPWLVLELTAEPDRAPTTCGTSLVASLVKDSDGVDTSGDGHLPDGVVVAFDGGDLGVVDPVEVGTVDGLARSLFVAGGLTGVSETSATVDSETATAMVTIEQALFCDGYETGDTSMW